MSLSVSLGFHGPRIETFYPRRDRNTRTTRRASSQGHFQEPKVRNDPRILDLTGRWDDLQLPISQQLQVLDLSENWCLDVEQVFGFNCPILQTLRLNHCDIVELPKNPPTYARSLKILSFDGNSLSEIPDWIFQLPEIQDLSFFGNNIESVQIPETNHTLKTVNLSHNPLKEITSTGTAKIQSLFLGHTLMESIPDLTKIECKCLMMAKCCIQGELAITLSKEIGILDLSGNMITSLSDDFVASCGGIMAINLANNGLTELPATLPVPNQLSRLVLTGNMLSEIPECFMQSSNIEQINISRNRLTKIPPFNFPMLRDLRASFNQLEEIPNCFEPCGYLSLLDLGHNKLTDLPKSLISCRRISDVILHSNAFDHIPSVVLSFASMRTLVMSNNKLTTLHNMLGGLFLLKTLDLSNNHITEVPKYIENMTELRFLSFSHNRISKIPEDLIWPGKLQLLDLSFNLIEQPVTFVPSLMSLSLEYNKLKEVPPLDNLTSLQLLSIAGNNIENGSIQFPPNCRAEVEVFGNTFSESVPVSRDKLRITDAVRVYCAPDDTKGIGIASSLGVRQTMEDAIFARSTPSCSLFGVFDGHAGFSTSTLCAHYFAKQYAIFEKEMSNSETAELLSDTFANLNVLLERRLVRDGCTAAFSLVKDGQCFTLGIGDSRVLRVYDNDFLDFEQLTTDHKPTDKEELARLKESGYVVSSDGRISRKLAVARSMGDFWCCEGGLYVDPEIVRFDITEDDRAIIIACDGLWDVVSNHLAAEIVRNSKTATDAAVTLKNIALAIGSADNISVIVVDFKPKPGDEGIVTRNTVEELQPYVEPPQEPTTRNPPVRGRRRR